LNEFQWNLALEGGPVLKFVR